MLSLEQQSPLPSSLMVEDLDAALDLLAERAVLGKERRTLLKQAAGDWLGESGTNALTRGLIGTGIGAAAGGAASLLEPEKKRRTVSSMLSGGLIGGSLGAGGSLLYDNWDKLLGHTDSQKQEIIDKAKAEVAGRHSRDPALSPEAIEKAKTLSLRPEQLINYQRSAGRHGGRAALESLVNEHLRTNTVPAGFTPPMIPHESGTPHPAHVSSPEYRAALTTHYDDRFKGVPDLTMGPFRQAVEAPGKMWEQAKALQPGEMADTAGFGGRSEGLWRDLHRTYGQPKATAPDLQAMFGPSDAAGNNNLGFTPAEALDAWKDGRQARDQLFNRLTGSAGAPAATRVEGDKRVPWTTADRAHFDQIVQQAARAGGSPGVLTGLPTTGSTYADVQTGVFAGDVAGNVYKRWGLRPRITPASGVGGVLGAGLGFGGTKAFGGSDELATGVGAGTGVTGAMLGEAARGRGPAVVGENWLNNPRWLDAAATSPDGIRKSNPALADKLLEAKSRPGGLAEVWRQVGQRGSPGFNYGSVRPDLEHFSDSMAKLRPQVGTPPVAPGALGAPGMSPDQFAAVDSELAKLRALAKTDPERAKALLSQMMATKGGVRVPGGTLVSPEQITALAGKPNPATRQTLLDHIKEFRKYNKGALPVAENTIPAGRLGNWAGIRNVPRAAMYTLPALGANFALNRPVTPVNTEQYMQDQPWFRDLVEAAKRSGGR